MNPLQQYNEVVQTHLIKRLRPGMAVAAFFYLAFYILDIIIYPNVKLELLAIRIFGASCLLGVAALTYFKFAKKYVAWLNDIGILSGSATICLLIYFSGGVDSMYYQGLNFAFIVAVAINSFQVFHIVLIGICTLVFYILSVMPSGIETNIPHFLMALAFMTGTWGFTVHLTYMSGKQHYSEFIKSQQVLEAERLKNQFFANVSHELRTPLSLILSPLESLIGGDYGEVEGNKKELVYTMHHNAMRLLKMVTDLLDFSKLEAGKVRVKCEPTKIVTLTQTILDDFKPLMEQKGLESELIAPKEDVTIQMDRYLYDRILFNLLSNAIKFTDKGGKVSIELVSEGDHLTLSVKDTGIGIPESAIQNLFKKFRQVEGDSTRRYEGTGLGLAMVKDFAELMKGRVRVESKQGVGTTMTVECEAPACDAAMPTKDSESVTRASRLVEPTLVKNLAPKPVSKSEAGNFLNVLIAEDNVELAAYMSSLLSPFCHTEVVHNGNEALEKIKANPPDLILSDVMMPGKDGVSLCREVKFELRLTHVPVVLITALTYREALLKGWEAGADEYLYKPFHPKELTTRIRSLLSLVETRKRVAIHEREVKMAMENALEGMAVFDSAGKFKQTNEAYLKLLGYSAEELNGMDWLTQVQPMDHERARSAYDTMMEVGKAEASVMGLRQDGTVFKMKLVLVKTSDEYLPFAGHYAFIKDVTDEQYKEALEMKTELLSSVSHEMRTPLLTLREGVWSITSGMMGTLNDKQKELLGIVLNSADRLARLVNQLLDYHKFDSGKAKLQRQPENINHLIQQVVKSMEPLLKQKQVQLKMNLAEDMPELMLDHDRITQVLVNLIDNAIKFTNEGTIEVTSANKVGKVLVSVRDTGIGIKAEDIPRLFRNFGQLETGKVQAPRRGTGLGLAISKKIIEQHYGEMGVESEFQKGSMFYFTLPTMLRGSKSPDGVSRAA